MQARGGRLQPAALSRWLHRRSSSQHSGPQNNGFGREEANKLNACSDKTGACTAGRCPRGHHPQPLQACYLSLRPSGVWGCPKLLWRRCGAHKQGALHSPVLPAPSCLQRLPLRTETSEPRAGAWGGVQRRVQEHPRLRRCFQALETRNRSELSNTRLLSARLEGQAGSRVAAQKARATPEPPASSLPRGADFCDLELKCDLSKLPTGRVVGEGVGPTPTSSTA